MNIGVSSPHQRMSTGEKHLHGDRPEYLSACYRLAGAPIVILSASGRMAFVPFRTCPSVPSDEHGGQSWQPTKLHRLSSPDPPPRSALISVRRRWQHQLLVVDARAVFGGIGLTATCDVTASSLEFSLQVEGLVFYSHKPPVAAMAGLWSP